MSKNRTVNLNSNASKLLNGATKVRVRVQETIVPGDRPGFTRSHFELQIRPTDRVSSKLLPQGERLYDLRDKRAARGQFCGPQNTLPTGAKRFTIPGVDFRKLECGTALRVEPRKHGWLAIIPCERQEIQARAIGGFAPAGATVRDR